MVTPSSAVSIRVEIGLVAIHLYMSINFTASLSASTEVDIVLCLDDSGKGIPHSMQKGLLPFIV